jgi:ligand-binding sensor domain-containing protein/two-component sensor histidine kinase
MKPPPLRLLRIALAAAFLAAATSAAAEWLTVRRYTAADGLSQGSVRSIAQDARGFLWFGTPTGLSRFDGYRFVTVGSAWGPSNPVVSGLIADAGGGLWVSTRGGGVTRLDSSGRPSRLYAMGADPAAHRVLGLYRDKQGRIWAGTQRGPYVLRSPSGEFELRRPAGLPLDVYVGAFAEDEDGTLWCGTDQGLMSWREDGALDPEAGRRFGIEGGVAAVLADASGTIWVGGPDGLWSLPPRSLRGTGERRAHRHRPRAGADYQVNALLETREGALWVATRSDGLLAWTGRSFARPTGAAALLDDELLSLFEDRDANVWAGTHRGVLRLAPSGFATFGTAEGLVDLPVVSIVADREGRVCALGPEAVLQCLREDGVRSVRVPVPPILARMGSHQLLLQDRRREWWVRSPGGVFRFPAGDALEVMARRPRHYRKGSGLPATRTARVFEDARGGLWFSVWGDGPNTLVRWDATTGAFESTPMPAAMGSRRFATSFAEDGAGTLWIGFFEGGVGRYRNGAVELVVPPRGRAGVVEHTRALHFDARGRLWFAAEQAGLGRIDAPSAVHPTAVYYGQAEGLAADTLHCVTEDAWGRLYVGTDLGVDRLDPDSGLVQHFGSEDGLARGQVDVCTRAAGRLWFGTSTGLSSLQPRLEAQAAAPFVFIEGLQVGGVPRELSPVGETTVDGVELPFPGHLQIAFSSVALGPNPGLRYQYRLEGSDADWSRPSDVHSVNYASLNGGRYRFQVRAVGADGRVSGTAASVAFHVVPPWWRQPWFLILALSLAGLLVASIVRYRVAMLLRVERVRTRIASDLHDDIGSNLAQIAIMGEVVQRRAGEAGAVVTEPLQQIAALSRESVASMSDIVWAIDPQKDRLTSLTHRMRRLASDTLPACGIEFQFTGGEEDIQLGADVRRQVFLIFKEALNNAVRHSGCSRIDIGLRADRGWLALEVRDDGKGFEPGAGAEGHGLGSLQRRAAALGGALAVTSSDGTRLTLEVPCRPPHKQVGDRRRTEG